MLEKYYPPDKPKRLKQTAAFVPPAASALAAAPKLSASVKAQLDAVSSAKLRETVEALSAFHTRHTRSPHLRQVAEMIGAWFQALGYADVKKLNFSREGLDLVNVVCTKPATGVGATTILLLAHFDSRMENLNDATARAPGANDNGTGIAIVLEIARVLAAAPLNDTIQFACYSGEEQGLWGSTAHAAQVQAAGTDVKFVVNLDQIGCPNAARELLIEQDDGHVVASNDESSQQLANRMATLAHDNGLGPVRLGPIYDSDYMPFEARGYVVVGMYETGTYPEYHTIRDTPDRVDYEYVANVAKTVLLAVTTP